MNSNCCCQRILDLCYASPCDVIPLPIEAPVEGVYTVVIEMAGSEIRATPALLAGTPIPILPSWRNEHYASKIRVYDPEGNVLAYEDDEGNLYDCFVIRNRITTYVI